MHVAHVNGCCKGIYTSNRLWLFSHALMLPKKTSFNIVEHGMYFNVDVTDMKTTKTTRFPNKNKNKGKPNYKSKLMRQEKQK
jgi:cytoskeletal protein CcmA (bactofilin family)